MCKTNISSISSICNAFSGGHGRLLAGKVKTWNQVEVLTSPQKLGLLNFTAVRGWGWALLCCKVVLYIVGCSAVPVTHVRCPWCPSKVHSGTILHALLTGGPGCPSCTS